mgnify:CR=1 FL=1
MKFISFIIILILLVGCTKNNEPIPPTTMNTTQVPPSYSCIPAGMIGSIHPNDEIQYINLHNDTIFADTNIIYYKNYFTPNGDGINDRFSMRDTSGGEDGGINFVIKDFCDSVHFDKVMDAPNHFGGVYDPTWPGWLFDD